MSDENEEIAMAECGSCRAIVPVDSKECPECGISFSGVSDEALGECGACNALVPLDSTKCPECGVVFVADDVIDILRTWMANNKMDVKTLFGRFDTNNDNMIDSGELKDGLLSLNLADLPPSQVDKLVAAIDEDGDSLIDLEELQTIIGGESLADTDESSETEEDEDTSAPLEYNENVLSKVMESNDINDSDKDAFIEFAKDFNEDGNSYLKKEELQAAAAAWNERSMDDESEEEESEPETEETVEDELEEEVETETDAEPEEEIVEEEDESIDESEEEDEPAEQEEIEEVVEQHTDEDLEEDEVVEEEEEVVDDEISDIAQRSTAEIMEQLLDIIDEQDKSLANAFGDLDDDGNRLLSSSELVVKLNEMLPEGLSEAEADELLASMDTDGDGNIDMVEFVNAIERHEDGISTIEDEDAETVKTFPTEWQSRFMSKKWHDVFWPLIHASFSIIIVGLLVNALFPIVDGSEGMVELDIRSDSPSSEWLMDDGTVVSEGDAYPCDPEIQEGKCKNSLTPLAGKASSMPGGFYWDAIALMVLAGVGLIWSLYTHLILAPGWRARVKAMKDVDDERAEVKEAIEEPEQEDSEADGESDDDGASETEEVDEEDVDDEEEELDIGSYVGLDIDGEEYYGTIIEFDDEEETVTIEEEETGDEIVGYQDEMFIPED